MKIGYCSRIIADFEMSECVQIAANAVMRDIKNTSAKCEESARSRENGQSKENGLSKEGFGNIVLQKADSEEIQSECFVVSITDGATRTAAGTQQLAPFASDLRNLTVSASDDLGLIYGLYHISKTFLGVNEFWFWNEQELIKEKEHVVPDDYSYRSEPFKVRFRGWFINDEVLFDGWNPEIDGQVDESFPWKMAFEALLRCGGNMTIPGTDFNAHKYKDLARRYGLWITHHHAEPLGARMFSRAYPDLEPSFDKHPDLFRGLWQESINDQKNCKVIWNLGFRGQGDRPFWADDPAYDTEKARGELMSSLIMEQYNMVKASNPSAICCTNLYGETMELYRDGYLSFPEDVIKIWADNGFGKMVSRRQGNHNPRVPALPDKADTSAHGIYYHASFYDLQAAAQMTMLPNSPEFVAKELSEVYAHGADDFWIINCSNVKPHTYYLDLIAKMWKNARVDGHLSQYVGSYYKTSLTTDIEKAYSLWPDYAPKYGPNEDDHAGEQFADHGARMLACGFIRKYRQQDPEKTAALPELSWCIDASSLLELARWLEEKYNDASAGYRQYLDLCMSVKEKLKAAGDNRAAEIFDHSLICQVQYLYYSYLGALHICRTILKCLDNGQGEEKYIEAFYQAGLAAKAFGDGYDTMRSHEHDIWKNFYENDCEADIRQSAFVAKSLMSYLRVLSDGPHFYKWQRMFQQDAGGDKVLLILRLKAHLTDDEIWELMTKNGFESIIE